MLFKTVRNCLRKYIDARKQTPIWVSLYYALAGINLITIIITLLLSHNVVSSFTESINDSKNWKNLASGFTKLEELAEEVNKPGNDVFNSYAVQAEVRKMKTKKREFDALVKTLKHNRLTSEHPEFSHDIRGMSDAVNHMSSEGDMLFKVFNANKLKEASIRMAAMDNHLRTFFASLRTLENNIWRIQSKELQHHLATIQLIKKVEYVIACFVLMLIGLVTFYGKKLSDNYIKSLNEKEALFQKISLQSEQLKQSLKEVEEIKFSLDQVAIVATTDIAGKIIYVNEQFCKISGYAQDELIGQNHRILNSGHHPPEFFKNMWHTISQGKIWKGEVKNKAKSGTFYWVETTIVPMLNPAGKPERYIALRYDITERKLMEEALLEAKLEAENANTAKSDFLANMSHEIRTPMNGIMGMCQLLLDTGLTPKQYDFAKTIDQSAESLLVIINDILDFSKIEAGKLSFENIPFHFRNAIDEMVELMIPKTRDRQFEFIVRVDPKIPKYLFGDPGRIRQILLNLLTNAFKFTESGQVSVNIQCREINGQNIRLYIEVEDSGKGIAQDKLSILFDKFTQEDYSTTRHYGGTGLGLAISKNLVEMMNGQIGVTSQIGKGSTFWFTIDLETREDEDADPDELSNLEHMNVLIVDDNAACRNLLQEYLASWDIPHTAVQSGEAALEELCQQASNGNAYTLALIDQQMPGMDGEMLAKNIKNIRLLQDTTLVLLTSPGSKENTKQFKTAGFSACLNKPISQSTLFDALLMLRAAETPKRFLTQHNVKAFRRDKTEHEETANSETQEMPKLRVLVAEDHLINKQVAILILEKLNITVDAVSNGKEAVEMSAFIPYDLILMDCQMPEMDGYEATAKIREREAGTGNHIPIIALTANSLKGDEEKCLAAGMDDYLTKPLKADQLEAVCRKWQPKTMANPVGC